MLPFSAVSEPFIVARDSGWFIVFKPSGMDSAAIKSEEEGTIAGWVRKNLMRETGRAENAFLETARDSGMLSRLDRDTSGLILCASDAESFNRLSSFQDRGYIRKRYRLLSSPSEMPMEGSRPARFMQGKPAGEPLELAGLELQSRFRSFGEGAKRVACISGEFDGTVYRTLSKTTHTTKIVSFSRINDDEAGGVVYTADVEIVKGFRHQIRAHMAWLGFPIKGDSLYGGRLASRLYLEACALQFPSPSEEGRIIEVSLYESESKP